MSTMINDIKHNTDEGKSTINNDVTDVTQALLGGNKNQTGSVDIKRIACTAFRKCQTLPGAADLSLTFLGNIGNFAMLVCAFFNIITDPLSFYNVMNRLVIVVIAAVLIVIESSNQNIFCTATCKHYAMRIKVGVDYWCKMLTKKWGLCIMYFVMGILGFADATKNLFLSMRGMFMSIASFYVIVIAIFYGGMGIGALIKAKKMRAQFGDEAQFDEAFEKYDINNDGYLDKEELINLSEALGSTFTKFEAEMIFDTLDYTHDGQIDREEFKTWWNMNKTFQASVDTGIKVTPTKK